MIKESKSISRKLFLAVHLLLLVMAALYIRDLKQLNHHYLFLDENYLASYTNFKKITDEKQILIIKVGTLKKLSDAMYREMDRHLKKLEVKSGECTFLTFKDIYGTDNLNSVRALQEKYKGNEKGLKLNLIGGDYISFLLICPPDVAATKISELINTINLEFSDKKYQLSFAGVPFVNYLLNLYSDTIQKRLFPLMFFCTFLLVLFFVRSWLSAILIFYPAVSSSLLTLALIKLFFTQMNMITSIVPLLIFVLNLSLSLHLYFSSGATVSIGQAFREKLIPIILTLITTSIGLGALVFSEILAIRQFAQLSFLSIILNGAVTISFAFLFFNLAKKERIDFYWLKNRLLISISRLKIYLTGILIVGSSLIILPHIPIQNEAAQYFPTASGLNEKIAHIYQGLVGNPNFEILLSHYDKRKLTFSDLKKIDIIEEEISNIFTSSKIFSKNSFIREANFLYSGMDILPSNKYAYQLLDSKMQTHLLAKFTNFIHGENSYYQITLMGKLYDHQTYEKKYKELQSILKKSGMNYAISGIYFVLKKSQNSLLRILFKSFFISLLIICTIIWIYFRNWNYVYAFFLVNVMPVFLSFLAMKIFSLSFNLATVMTFSISLGLVVDSSLYIGFGIKKNISAENFINNIMRPILVGSITLIISFLILATYNFLPIREFGICLSVNIFTGLLLDIYILPNLLDYSFAEGESSRSSITCR